MKKDSNRPKRVLIGLSGGVDSAVAAALLKTQGYEVLGAFLNIWDPSTDKYLKQYYEEQNDKEAKKKSGKPPKVPAFKGSSCCIVKDSKKAKEICDHLEMPLHTIDVQELYQAEVLDYVVSECLSARKPHPCVKCNTNVKLISLMAKAEQLKCDYIATGHYAKIVQNPDGTDFFLYRGADHIEDQSYYLAALRQDQLAKVLTPLGDLIKTKVKRMAITFELPVEEHVATQEICFVDGGGYEDLVLSRSTDRYRPGGPIVNKEGSVLDRHQGLYKFTTGSDRSLDNIKDVAAEYVVMGYDLKVAALIVGPVEDLKKRGLFATHCNWIGKQDFMKGMYVTAKLFAKQPPVPCRITLLNGNSVRVEFDEPQTAVVPGQPIVFYQEEAVIGGGWVENVLDPIVTKLRARSAHHLS